MLGLFKRRKGGPVVTTAARKIAILTSTRPLRITRTRRHRSRERFNPQAAVELAQQFDLIIVGSTASDAVFDYMSRHMTTGIRQKFRFYNRSFFESYAGRSLLGQSRDQQTDGWKAILRENGIDHELTARVLGDDFEYHTKAFNWHEIGDFINDRRVSLVTGDNGHLYYERPHASGTTE